MLATQNVDAVPSPLVNSIVATLAQRIYEGHYHDRNNFPSERALEAEFQVSRRSVRLVLEMLEAQGLIVRSARCRTLVRAEGASEALRVKTRRRTIGIGVLASPREPGTMAVLQGIACALDQEAYRLVIGNFAWESEKTVQQSEARFLEQMIEDQDIAGILVEYLGGRENLPILHQVRAASIPIVFLDHRPPPGFEADYVGVDNFEAAKRLVTHLILRGHRRIAHITNGDEQGSPVQERLAGYRQALAEVGIPFRPEWIVMANQTSHAEALHVHGRLAERLLQLSEPPTAVFAVNDVEADWFKEALWARGLRIPEDMALVGFDGIERWQPREPFMTTASQPFERMGACALEILLRRIESNGRAPYQEIVLEAPLEFHGSTLTRR
jgi:LacI family transcriptional regulator